MIHHMAFNMDNGFFPVQKYEYTNPDGMAMVGLVRPEAGLQFNKYDVITMSFDNGVTTSWNVEFADFFDNDKNNRTWVLTLILEKIE